MPDIIIRGMEMPVEQPVTLILDLSGRVWLPDIKSSKEYMASELPPHGDLIDMDKIRYTELYGGVEVTTANWIDSLPVVVPASEEGSK